MLEGGLGIEKDEAAARGAYEVACEAGDGRGCHLLAEMQSAGKGGPVDLAGARASVALACAAGETAACGE